VLGFCKLIIFGSDGGECSMGGLGLKIYKNIDPTYCFNT
jgi:hypothetical protein